MQVGDRIKYKAEFAQPGTVEETATGIIFAINKYNDERFRDGSYTMISVHWEKQAHRGQLPVRTNINNVELC